MDKGRARRAGSSSAARIVAVDGAHAHSRSERVATEEPLEIRLTVSEQQRTLAVTMRTPGADFELVAGFLLAEGVVSERDEIRRMRYCVGSSDGEEQHYNVINVELAPRTVPDLRGLQRHFFTSSSCGVCGKASLDALRLRGQRTVGPGPSIEPDVLYELPDKLRKAQSVFESTGGLHAAGLFDASGELLALREDVGRHNALDKLLGWALMSDILPLAGHILMVSGRTSFEILQKALASGIPFVCGVSAPSSLAVDLGREFDMTLVGFLRRQRFNIYAGAQRVVTSQPEVVS